MDPKSASAQPAGTEGKSFIPPPRLPTWLLRHLGCGADNEALVGDLCERFQQVRNARWYLKESLISILESFFKEITSHKLQAVFTVFAGWCALGLVWFLCEALVGSSTAWTRHACTFIWFITGSTSGFAVRAVAPAVKRPLIVLFAASILLFLVLFHPRSTHPHVLVYWVDTAVLTLSILMSAVPAVSAPSFALTPQGGNCS